MTFEDEFPSLKDKKQAVCNYDADLDYIKNCESWKHPEYIDVFIDDDLFFSIEDVKKHCLDKQRVKEVIKKAKDDALSFTSGMEERDVVLQIEKYLGLEN